MKAITLNLLAEENLAHRQRARDPLKAAIAIAVGLVTIVLGVGVWYSIQAGTRKTAASELQSKLDRLASMGVVAGEDAFRDTQRVVQDVKVANQARFLCAPQLALLKDVLPRSVELTHVSFSVSLESEAATPAPADEPGGKAKRVVRAKTTERLMLVMDGRALGASPELEVDHFLQTMRAHAGFSEGVDTIQLRSIARAPLSTDPGGATVPSAAFVIECRYKERP